MGHGVFISIWIATCTSIPRRSNLTVLIPSDRDESQTSEHEDYGTLFSWLNANPEEHSAANISQLRRTLIMIRKSDVSDQSKIALLESIGVYSRNESMQARKHSNSDQAYFTITRKRRTLFFEPEFWSSGERSYEMMLARTNDTSFGFHHLSQIEQMLVMCSRIVTQAIYPFFVEIQSIHKYLKSAMNIYSIHQVCAYTNNSTSTLLAP